MALMQEFGGFRYLPSRLAERLRGVEVGVRRPMDGSHQGMHKSPAFGSSVEFAEYREYLPGDPVARIDWPVYARSDRYLIRQYHEDVSIRCFVLLDISESMSYQGDGPISKMAYASTLAAGMMYLMVQQGDTVSLMTFDDRVRKFHEPAGTLPGLKPMLLGLEEIEAKRKGDIEAALHEAAEQITGRTLVILISDLLQEPEQVMRGVHHLYHDGKELTVFHVLDPAELRLPAAGLVEIMALETRDKLTVDLQDIRESYLEQIRLYLDELRRGCMNVRAEYLLAETKNEVFDLLMERSRRI